MEVSRKRASLWKSLPGGMKRTTVTRVVRIDELFERDVVQVELSGDGNHHAVVFIFAQSSIGSHAQ